MAPPPNRSVTVRPRLGWILTVGTLQKEVTALLGSDAGFMDNAEIQQATTSNMRLLAGCLLWGGYWSTSKRVRVRFGPAESASV